MEPVNTPLEQISAGVTDNVLSIIFFVLMLFFAIHSAIVAYHWLTYSNHRSQAFLAVVVHIGVGALILGAMGSILYF